MSFVRVSSHVFSPSKSQVSARMARISGNMQNCGPLRSKALCGTTFPPFLAFGLKTLMMVH